MRISESSLRRIIRDVIMENEEVDWENDPWGLAHHAKMNKAKDNDPRGLAHHDNMNKAKDNDHDLSSDLSDDEPHEYPDLFSYAVKVLEKCKKSGYTQSFVDNDAMFLKEPIKIGLSYRNLVDIRNVLKQCFDAGDSVSSCASSCIESWKKRQR